MILLLALLPALASPAFERGVEASRAGDQPAAVGAFAEALAEGAVDPAVYHGLGNALYRQEQVGPAIAAWMRGLRLSPGDADLRANLAYARARTQDRLDLPAPSIGPFLWQGWLSPATQARLAGGFATLGLSAQFLLALRARQRSQPSPRPHPGLLLSLLLALLLGLGAALDARRPPAATVLLPQVTVRSALGAEGVELFVLHEGAVVRTLERWEGGEAGPPAAVLIELPDARKGWVPASAVDLALPDAPFPLP